MAADTKYFFVHIHKTAGTSLWKRLDNQFGTEQKFPNLTDGVPGRRTLSIDDLVDRWPARRDDVRVLAGHFPLCTAQLLGTEFTTFTLLRHPVSRVLSALREQRQKLPEFSSTPFEEIYREPLRHVMLRNHTVKMFSLTPDTMDAGALTAVDFTPEHLERAKEGLDSVDLVGFQDDFDGFCDRLAARYGWDLGRSVTMNSSRPEDIPPSLIDHIAEDNALDIALYDYAVERYRSG